MSRAYGDSVSYDKNTDVWCSLKSKRHKLTYGAEEIGSGSTRPGTNSAPESTRPRVNSAGSTRPVYFPYGESGYNICT